MAIVPTAGWLLVVELCNLAMYASGQVILGAYRTPASVGLYEGPVRAHNLLYALGGALAVPVVPGVARYGRRRAPPGRAGGTRQPLHAGTVRARLRHADRAGRADPRGLARRALRGRRCRARPARLLLAALRRPDRDPRLPGRGRPGARAGARDARGRRGQPGARAGAHARARPRGTRRWPPHSRSSPPSRSCSGSACARRASRSASCWGGAYLPALVLGANLALKLVPARIAFDPDTLPLVLGLALAGPLLYWLTYYRLVLDPAERVRPRLPQARLSSESAGAPRSRSDTISSSSVGHSIPTAGSSKRKPDSRTGS